MVLKDRVAVITGASDGLGKEFAFALAKEKVKLGLISRNEEKLGEVKKEALSLGSPEVIIFSCDITETKKVVEVLGDIYSHFGRIDILINNAGIWQKMALAEEVDDEVIDQVIATNLTAQIHVTRAILPIMKGQKEGAIINVISKSGVVPQEGQAVYSASKYGLRGFTEVVELELKGSGVRVAGLYQGGVETQMFAKAGDKVALDGFIKAKDLAKVIVFALSQPENTWLSHIRVDH